MKDDLFGAISFLTVFGRGDAPRESSVLWFSVAGALIAAVSGLIWRLLDHSPARLLEGAVVVLVIVVITGAIHFDGLADAADGLLAHLDGSRRFAVMSGPEVGAFGIVAVVMALLLMSLSLSTITPNVLLLVGVMSLSRELAALVIALFPYAKPSGIVSGFRAVSATFRTKAIISAELLASSAVIVAGLGLKGLVLPAVMFAVQAIIITRAKALIGGYTGDVLGASIVATETLALVAGALMQR